MIALDVHLSEFPTDLSGSALAGASELDLRYRACLGDIIIRSDDCDLSTSWAWVPILDFIASLKLISRDLGRSLDAEAVYEFTESDATLAFLRSDEFVTIRSSYVDQVCIVPWAEFEASVSIFLVHAIDKVLDRYPDLRQNAFIGSLRQL